MSRVHSPGKSRLLAKQDGERAAPIDDNTRLMVDGSPKQVVGVTPPSFLGLAVGESFDIVQPFCKPAEGLQRNAFDVTVMGRLKPGWTVTQASTRVMGLSPGIMAATQVQGYDSRSLQEYLHFRLGAFPAGSGVSYLRDEYDSSLRILLAITGLVLLIACANLGNFLLTRATTREREVAVRLALGAARRRLIRQLLVESSLLAALGTAVGVGIAQVLGRILVHGLSTEDSIVTLPTGIDWRVLLFAASVAVMTCLIFGTAPALRASAIDPISVMRSGGRSMTASRERFSFQRLMIVMQVSVSLVLLILALLFVRSFYNVMTFYPGMREQGVTLAFVGFSQSHIGKDRAVEFERQLTEEVRSIPGVVNAATTTTVPLSGMSWTHVITAGSVDAASKFTWVGPGYFQTLDIPVLGGRGFQESDTATSQRVAVVNQAFIRRFFPGMNPIGQTLRTHAEPDYPATVYEIVGTIPDTLYNDIRGLRPPMIFAPASQFPDPRPWTTLMVRSNLTQAAAEQSIRRRLALHHPELIVECRGFQQRVQDGLVRERMMAMLSGFFGAVAALLSMIGLYGVISYFVTRRCAEIGIRLAMGAARGQVVVMILRDAALLIGTGLAIGLVLALASGQGAASLLFHLKPYDPETLIAATGLLSVVGLLASFLPAHRASRLDPTTALRSE